MSKKKTSSILPFVAGAFIGAGIAFLTAPKKGSETRELLKEKIKKDESFCALIKSKVNDIRELFREDEIISSDGEIIISKEFSIKEDEEDNVWP